MEYQQRRLGLYKAIGSMNDKLVSGCQSAREMELYRVHHHQHIIRNMLLTFSYPSPFCKIYIVCSFKGDTFETMQLTSMDLLLV